MTHTQYRAALAALGLTVVGAARLLDVDERTSRRWAMGDRPIPGTVARFLSFLISAQGDIICQRPPEEESSKNWYANARLIAAAPDMLAALEKAYAFLNLASQDTMAAKIGRDVATVIAAATGKQP
jgi:hypothetical protein